MTGSYETARRLAKHYFGLLGSECGVHWTADNDTEVEELVDAIIDAAAEQVQVELEARLDTVVEEALSRRCAAVDITAGGD